jgi:glycosyltransferase involved in cell wall biosynthesis
MDTSMIDIQVDDLEGKFRQLGVKFHRLTMERQGKNPLNELRTLYQLLQIMRDVRPDISLNYAIKSSLYGSLAARLARVKNYYSSITGLGYLFASDSRYTSPFKKAMQHVLGIALSGNTRVFFQNTDDRDLFLQLGLLRDKTHSVIVNGSGVDLERFAEVPLPPAPVTFLMVARIQHHKGVVEYINAARILRQIYPEIRFQLLGPFDDHPSAISPVEFQRLLQDGAVEFLGGTPDVRPYLAGCHVCVLPSYREGTPLSTLEAMAVGRAVVTTDVPGCRETVDEGYNGFLVPAKNVTCLADAMQRFLDSPDLISLMGKRSRQIAEEKFDVNKIVNKMLKTMELL